MRKIFAILGVYFLLCGGIFADDIELGGESIDSTNNAESNNTDSTNAAESNQTAQKDLDSSLSIFDDLRDKKPASTQTITQNQADEAEQRVLSLLEHIYGHLGFFGKSNSLNKAFNDRYGVFSASAGLKYNFLDKNKQTKVEANIGIFGMTSIYNGKFINDYVRSKFITNNAFLKYRDDYADVMEFELRVGRHKAKRDWLKHYIQGVGIDVNYKYVNVWLDWADDQAFVSREFLSDFDTFRRYYNKQWLIAGGIDGKFFGIAISPYYYLMNDNFWVVGGKVIADYPINKAWSTTTTIHYSYLRSQTRGIYGERFSDISNLQSRNDPSGNGMLIFVDEAIKYSGERISSAFGFGAVVVLDSDFELAKLGNMSRFETSDLHDFKIIEPGGIYGGDNATNMFNANTTSFYGFAEMGIDEKYFLSFLGRNSKGSGITQDSISLGGRWNIIPGLNVGGIMTYLTHNKQNRSFMKGYLEFAI